MTRKLLRAGVIDNDFCLFVCFVTPKESKKEQSSCLPLEFVAGDSDA